MTVAEIIAVVDQLRPNQYDEEQKTMWLSEVEGIIVDEIVNRAEGKHIRFDQYCYEADAEKETILPARFIDIYLHYIRAKMELYDDEMNQYNNSVMAYQTAYDSYAAFYRRTHMPKQYTKFDIFNGGGRHGKAHIHDRHCNTEEDDRDICRN